MFPLQGKDIEKLLVLLQNLQENVNTDVFQLVVSWLEDEYDTESLINELSEQHKVYWECLFDLHTFAYEYDSHVGDDEDFFEDLKKLKITSVQSIWLLSVFLSMLKITKLMKLNVR